MTYWLGKDVDIYITTEQLYLAVSGNITTNGMTAVSGAIWDNVGTGDYFGIPMRGSGAISATKITDVTGIDFSPTTVDENVSFMGKNTNLTAEVKKSLTLTVSRKVSNPLFDYVFQHARDGAYSTNGIDEGDGAAIFDGLTTSNNQNFGYRLYLQFASGTTIAVDETLVLRNCCMTSHSKSLSPDGTTEETIEFYSYVQPLAGLSDMPMTALTSSSAI